jgi:hypothetical protein
LNRKKVLEHPFSQGGVVLRVFLVFSCILFFAQPIFAQVDTAWVRRYNGPGNNADEATAIAVDGSHNVYVTGRSVGSGADRDFATVKYDTDGDTVWVRRYNGPGSGPDYASAMAVEKVREAQAGTLPP